MCRQHSRQRAYFAAGVVVALGIVPVLGSCKSIAFTGKNDEILRSLTKDLENPDTHLRVGAVKALGELCRVATAAVPSLERAMGDDDADVRAQAAVSVWKITGDASKSVPVINKLLRSENRRDRRLAIEAIYVLQGAAKDAGPILIELTTKLKKGGDRVPVIHAMGYVGVQPGIIQALVSLLTDKSAEVRLQAAQALGNLTIGGVGPDVHG